MIPTHALLAFSWNDIYGMHDQETCLIVVRAESKSVPIFRMYLGIVGGFFSCYKERLYNAKNTDGDPENLHQSGGKIEIMDQRNTNQQGPKQVQNWKN